MTKPEVKPSPGRSLTDLRRTHPTDSTLENLLAILRAELDLCARLPVFEYEATAGGYDDCASLLRRLAETERVHVDDILSTLRRHLDQREGRKARTA
jgi:rubrerythrin